MEQNDETDNLTPGEWEPYDVNKMIDFEECTISEDQEEEAPCYHPSTEVEVGQALIEELDIFQPNLLGTSGKSQAFENSENNTFE